MGVHSAAPCNNQAFLMRCYYCYDLWSDCYKIFVSKSVLCCPFVGSSVRNLPFEQIRTAVFKKIQN